MINLTWKRIAAGSWELRSDDGRLWASVAPEPQKEPWHRRMWRETCHHPEMLQYLAGTGGRRVQHWSLGATVAAAKRQAENWLSRNQSAVENFAVAA